jgi:adenylate kinase family enzyme
MKRIIVIGSGGAGKSTFARRLGEILRLPVIHLDSLYWRPNWVETPKPEWRQRVTELVQGEAWIIDGNYSGTLDLRLVACDTVVFLDLSRVTCIRRALGRVIKHRGASRRDMAPGCPERFDLKFLWWIWDFPRRTRPKLERLFTQYAVDKKIVRLSTPAQVEAFLNRLPNELFREHQLF